MLLKVYEAQQSNPVKGDWYKLLKEDKIYFDFDITDDNLMEKYPKKNSFKNAIKRKQYC